MSLRLPLQGSAARALFDVAQLAEMTMPGAVRVPGFPKARRDALAWLNAEPAARSVNVICQRADASLWLVEFRRPAKNGNEGNCAQWRKRWDFGALVHH